jgi:hypothetical protein
MEVPSVTPFGAPFVVAIVDRIGQRRLQMDSRSKYKSFWDEEDVLLIERH